MECVKMVGVHPDGRITCADIDYDGNVVEEKDMFTLTDEEKAQIQPEKLEKPIYFESNPKPIKIREIPNSLPCISLPEKPSDKFDLWSHKEFFLWMLVKNCIIKRYTKEE